MQSLDCDVTIVGHGIVGATLACALLQEGMRVVIIEAQPPLESEKIKTFDTLEADIEHIDLRTFALTKASERIFTHLGIWQNITAQRISPFRKMHVWDAGGSGEIHFDSATLNEPTLGYIVEQKVIRSALATRLADFDNLTYYRPAKVQTFNLTTDKAAMQVQLDNGHCLTTQLLIGAEGANSPIRTLAGLSYKLRDHGQQAIVTVVKTSHSHQETAWQRFLPTGPLAFLPLFHPQISSIVWSIDTPLAQRLMALKTELFHQELEQAFAFKLGEIKHSGRRVVFPLQSRYVLNYVQPRLALVGDAAHTVLPLAGQGLNLGLLDAATLSEVILDTRAKGRDIGHYQELRRYERWRKTDNLIMLKLMEGFKSLFGTRSGLLTWGRNIGLHLTNTALPIKTLIMQQAMGLRGQLPRLAQEIYVTRNKSI